MENSLLSPKGRKAALQSPVCKGIAIPTPTPNGFEKQKNKSTCPPKKALVMARRLKGRDLLT
jgi:hypothetical protein